MGVGDFAKSLWNDPYRWSLVKGIAMFGLAIYIAHELEAAENMDETVQQLGSLSGSQ